jgi:ATP-dependent Clp protease adaptor protein ClpS
MNDRDEGAVAAPLSETVVRPKQQQRQRPKRQPRYNVILWNDDDHTYEYVIAMLMQLFGHTQQQGYQLAKEVDIRGKAVVLTTTLEHAELKRDQIHAFGKDGEIPDCKGSMWATVEAVESE